MHYWIRALLAGIVLSLAPLAAQAEGISTHILDISNGVGRADVPVTLMTMDGDSWTVLGSALTEDNGRVESFGEGIAVGPGTYKMVFDMSGTDDVPESASSEPFFPEIDVVFNVSDPERDYHIPILLSPYGYSTYLGN